MVESASRKLIAKLFGAAIISQVFSSASAFLIAIVLLRNLGTAAYGSYVLFTVTILLLATVQNGFFLTPMVAMIAAMGDTEIEKLLGNVIPIRNRVVNLAYLVAGAGALLLFALDEIDGDRFGLLIVALTSGYIYLAKDFARGILLSNHKSDEILIYDILNSTLNLALTYYAVAYSHSVLLPVAVIGLTSLLNFALYTIQIRRKFRWKKSEQPKMPADLINKGAWLTFGSAVHWSFSQGYVYLAAALLDTRAVGAIAATRLLFIPINLMSTGVEQALFPLASKWYELHGIRFTAARMKAIAAGMLMAALVYSLLAWNFKGIFFEILDKTEFAGNSKLIFGWNAIFILMLVRDQFSCLLMVISKLKQLGNLTVFAAVAALTTAAVCMPQWKEIGALVGIFVGEGACVLGMLYIYRMR